MGRLVRSSVPSCNSSITSKYGIDDGGTVRVLITNPTNGDYRDVDLEIRANFPQDYIDNAQDLSGLPGCSIAPPQLSMGGLQGESVRVEGFPPRGFNANFMRIRCDKFPSHTILQYTFTLFRSADQGPKMPVMDISEVDLIGKYSRLSRAEQNQASVAE